MSHLSDLQARLADLKADGVLLSSEINQRYLTDFPFSDGYVLVTPRGGYLLTDPRYAEAAEAQAQAFTVLCTAPGQRMSELLLPVLKRDGITTLAIEEDDLSVAAFGRLRETLSPCRLIEGGSRSLTALRMVKTEEELSKIAEAQAITDAAFAHILKWLTPTVTEREVALELDWFMRQQGADGCAFDTIAVSGSSSSLPHGVPRNAPLERGFLTMDFGAKRDGYCSDMTRTVCIGKVSEEMRQVYQTVLAAQRAALDFLAEGVRCSEADAAARSLIEAAGYGAYFGHSLGHGVGLYIHESPSLSRKADPASTLCRGHVVTVEPGIYLPGRFGCRIEDMVAIGHDGVLRNFTGSPKELIEL